MKESKTIILTKKDIINFIEKELLILGLKPKKQIDINIKCKVKDYGMRLSAEGDICETKIECEIISKQP